MEHLSISAACLYFGATVYILNLTGAKIDARNSVSIVSGLCRIDKPSYVMPFSFPPETPVNVSTYVDANFLRNDRNGEKRIRK